MSVFAYTAMGKDGKLTSGTLTCDSRAAALQQIGRQGLHPVKLEEARNTAVAAKKAQAAASTAPGRVVGKVPAKAVETFTRELANLLAGGVPLSRAMALLRRESSNPAAKQMWGDIHEDIMGGATLADAMAKHPKSFSSVYLAMIRAGEAGGFLDVVLNQIADFRAREGDLKGKVKAAMVYPIILACLAVCVVIFLLTYFIPQFQSIFNQFGSNLPLLTQVIVAASNVLKHYGPFVAAALVIIFVVGRRVLSTPNGRRQVESATLATPVLGNVIAHFGLVRFARMLGTLVGSGVPLIASLRVAREAIGNQILADTLVSAIEKVQQGTPLSKALSENQRLFPPSVVEMIAVSEETGRLDKELVRLAVTYEADLDRQLRLLVSILEPMMLFLMAGIIGTIVIGMLLPVLNLSDIVK
jgi:type II secretory pathway component PulF